MVNDRKVFGRDDFVLLHDSARNRIVRCSEIVFFEANGNDTVVHLTGDRRISIHKAISRCGKMVDDSMFFRTDRSHIVNLDFVREVEMADAKRFLFVLENGVKIILSRRESINLRREKTL